MNFTGRARVRVRAPEAFGVCDNCGIWYNRDSLVPEMQYQGNALSPTGFLVCTVTCLDVPQPQLQSPILPNDPQPVVNPRIETSDIADRAFSLASSTDPASSGVPISGVPS
jgi:hypothetical protein